MTTPDSSKPPSPLSAFLQGWVHQGNVTLLVTYVSLIVIFWFMVQYVLPVDLTFGLVAIAILLLVFVGLAIVSGWHVTRMDSTEALTLRGGDLILRAKSPSIAIVQQSVQLLLRIAQKPDAIIPPNIDPKDDPSKFKKLTGQESSEVLVKELEKVLGQDSIPESITPAPIQDGGASLPP